MGLYLKRDLEIRIGTITLHKFDIFHGVLLKRITALDKEIGI